MTKQLTKQEVEAVVERLVDKTLSEGCIIESDGIKYHVARAAKKIIYCYLTWTDRETNIIKFDRVNDKYQIIGHQVMIGNVLYWMQNVSCEHMDDDTFGIYCKKLCLLWEPLIFTCSLQDIIEASGYQTLMNSDNNEVHQELVSPEANALFTFLQEIL